MDIAALNLDVVDRHIRGEAQDVDSVLSLYTDDVVLAVPGRDVKARGKQEIRALLEFPRGVDRHPRAVRVAGEHGSGLIKQPVADVGIPDDAGAPFPLI